MVGVTGTQWVWMIVQCLAELHVNMANTPVFLSLALSLVFQRRVQHTGSHQRRDPRERHRSSRQRCLGEHWQNADVDADAAAVEATGVVACGKVPPAADPGSQRGTHAVVHGCSDTGTQRNGAAGYGVDGRAQHGCGIW